MPIICSFYGIVIKMFFAQREHDPPVREWAAVHQNDLRIIWDTQHFRKLEGLR
jgi:hypothetical protein